MKESISNLEAKEMLLKYIKTPHLLLHSRETEAIMRNLAKHFNQNEDLWGLTGLLHDLDLDLIGKNVEIHGNKTVDILREEGFEIPEMFEAIISHAEGTNESGKRTTNFHFCLAAAENITGMISAYVMILPQKKLLGVESSSINKRLKQLRFAAAVNRNFVYDIEKTGLQLNDFLEIALNSMKEISDEIGM